MNADGYRSGKFRMSRWQCYFYMLIHHALWLAWTLLIVISGMAVVGFLCSPWIGIVALGVDALIVVMSMSFVIIAYGFTSITGANMADHALRSEGNVLRIEFEDGKEIEVQKSDIRPYHIYPGGVIVPVEGKKSGWIWIPPRAFETDEEFQNFLKRLYINESNTE